jgi:hypothetical protein
MGRLFKAISTASEGECKGDHHSRPYHREFAIQENNEEEDCSGADGEMGKR